MTFQVKLHIEKNMHLYNVIMHRNLESLYKIRFQIKKNKISHDICIILFKLYLCQYVNQTKLIQASFKTNLKHTYSLVACNPINSNVLQYRFVYLLKKLRENLGKLYSSALVKQILLSTSVIYISALEIHICIDNFYVKYCSVLGSSAKFLK